MTKKKTTEKKKRQRRKKEKQARKQKTAAVAKTSLVARRLVLKRNDIDCWLWSIMIISPLNRALSISYSFLGSHLLRRGEGDFIICA